MAQFVVFKLGQGNWQQGFPNVTAQLWEVEGAAPTQFTGSLPPAPGMAELYRQWRSLYEALYYKLNWHCPTATRSLIEIEEEGVTNVSRTAFNDLCEQLQTQFNRWLDDQSFSKLERRLRTKLSPSDEIRVIVETDDPQLRRFPWHLWAFFEDYSHAEVALCVPEYGPVERLHRAATHPVRILAVLGSSEGIDVQQDRALLERLPTAETVFLVEPQRRELDQQLWDERGWDIFFFAGHSTSQANGEAGEMALNPTDRLTIAQLKNALKAAIARGLKIAIFNSCDGLGLARGMADLNIPQLVVMREPVPDPVAQEFLKHLLTAFAGGRSFYQSVREAREKLQGLEDVFPCASWLPVICHNPAETSPDWQSLLGTPEPSVTATPQKDERRNWSKLQIGFVSSALVTVLVMGLRFLGVLQAAELMAFDSLMRQRPPEIPDPRILVVEVTEEDTNHYGYPIEDQTLAELIQTLAEDSPRVIGLDMHRYQPRGAGREEFIAQFQQHPTLLTVCSATLTDRNLAPPREFLTAQLIDQVGFSDLMLDGPLSTSSGGRSDLAIAHQHGVVRRQLLSYDPRLSSAPSACVTPFSLSFYLALQFLKAEGVQPIEANAVEDWQIGSVAFKKLTRRFGGYQSLDGLSSQILINYRSGLPGQRVTLHQVLQGQVDREFVKDRVVLIGTTAAIAGDASNTPYGDMPGVWIHAHMVSQVLSSVLDARSLIWTLPQQGDFQWGDLLWVLAWSSVGGILVWACRARWLLGLTNVVAAFVLYEICLVVLIHGGWVPFIPSLLALLLTSGASHTLITLNRWRQS